MANGNGSGGSVFWKDDEIVVDREGIPHYTGNRPELMREYRKRVLFAYSSLEGDGDTEEKEKRDLKKKQKAFAKKLLNGLHGEAWRACQDLITDMARLSEERGFQHVLSALQSIEKVTVIKKTEQFDRFFERGFRKRGQALDAYLRSRKLDWAELQELDSETKMSSDLLAYFVLKQSGLSKDDRYVFYFDASDTVPGPACWRGVARVIGKEGTHTVWIAHRGIILAVSPEHLAFADDHEVQNWSVVGSEVELLDTQPAAGGNTFVDLRQQPKPSREGYEPEAGELEDLPRPLLDQPMPQADEELYEPTDPGDHLEAPPVAEEPLAPSLMPPAESEDLSSDSLSMARMKYESERDAKKAIKSSEFFAKKREERLQRQEERRQRFQQSEAARQFEAASIPIPRAEYDPDVDDYHQSVPSPKRLPAISEDPDADARERESKRLRSAEEITSADAQASGLFACDLVYENGVVQRAKGDACVGDLVRLKQYLAQAKRGADFRLRYWSDVNLRDGVLILLADSGHANGTPEKDEIMRYRSVGGYFILIANKEILEDKAARANVLTFYSGQTKRVCSSTLAAEASHLAEAVECGDWCACLLEEALTGDLNLKDWPSIIQRRVRVYVTDARSVYDYLQKDATSTSTDKRMAIEETVRQPNALVRWIDGMQNIANVLTKANAEKETLKEFLRSGQMSLVQTEENKILKETKRRQRQNRNVQRHAEKAAKPADHQRRSQLAAEIQADDDDHSSSGQTKE
ncbi:unnamed protein product [Durusdinium trenchii]|uniref:Uncharacterized protein n=1 Tax=Durusdinium trenchii TaxID=1381693 RepID=A0ABP0KAI1_9DINO